MSQRPGSRLRPRRTFASCLAVSAMLLVACGDGDVGTSATDEPGEPTSAAASELTTPSTEQTSEPSESAGGVTDSPSASLPPCAQVWVAGDDLPKRYTGCADDEGAEVAPDTLSCSSGQAIIRFQDRYYGVAGGLIREAPAGVLNRDKGYRSTITACRA